MVNYLVDLSTNTFTMVVPFADIVAWLWQMSHPYPREPLQKGWGEGGLAGISLFMPTGRDKN